MNKVYRVVWNKATQTWNAVQENAKAHGKSPSTGIVGSVQTGVYTAVRFVYTIVMSGVLIATGQVAYGANGTEYQSGTDNLCYYDTTTQSVICGDTAASATNTTDTKTPKSVVMGMGATSDGETNVAIGSNSVTKMTGAVAIGGSAKALDNQAIAIGLQAEAAADWDISIGRQAGFGTVTPAGEGRNIAIGDGALRYATAPNNNIAMGTNTGGRLSGNRNVLLGTYASNHNAVQSAMVALAAMDGKKRPDGKFKTYEDLTDDEKTTYANKLGVTLDASSKTYYVATNNTVALGHRALATKAADVAIGQQAKATGGTSVAVGNGSYASQANDVAVGREAKAVGSNSIAQGTYANAGASGAIAMGVRANAIDATTTKTTGVNSIAIGTDTNAAGQSSNAIGNTATATGKDSASFGSKATATHESALAVGSAAQATNTNAVAVGGGAVASAVGASALGRGANATGTNAVSVGIDSLADKDNAVAIGVNSKAQNNSNIAIGNLANATGATSAISIGRESVASNTSTVAMGYKAQASGTSAIAVGSGSLASGISAIAIGNGSDAAGERTTVIGSKNGNVAATYSAIVGTSNAITSTTDVQVYGNTNTISRSNTYVLGSNNTVSGATESAVIAGRQNTMSGTNGVAVGRLNTVAGPSAVAIGQSSQALGTDGIAIGNKAYANRGENAVALGGLTHAGQFGTALGARTSVEGDQGAAVATGAVVKGARAVAVGSYSFAGPEDAVALGHNTAATGSRAVAMGAGSVVSGARSGAWGIATNGGQPQNNTTDRSFVGGTDSYAIGNKNIIGDKSSDSFVLGNNVKLGATGASIAITNVAGRDGTTNASTRTNAVTYTGATAITGAVALGSDTSVTVDNGVALGKGSVASTAAGQAGTDPLSAKDATASAGVWKATHAAVSVGDGTTVTRQITSVAAGTQDTDAVNVAQLKAAGFTLAASNTGGGESTTVPNDKIQNGETVTVDAGKNIKVTHTANQVSIATKDEVEFTQITLGDSTNNTVLTSTTDGLDVGGDKITNVANGDVSANSKEAINGSQLYTTNQNVANNATAIANNATEIAKGLNFGANDQTATSNTAINRKLGDTIGIKGGITDTSTATSGENVITRTDANGNINIELAKNAKFDSVTTGGTKLSDAGLSFVDTSGSPVANSPSISNTGINAGNQVIAGVKAGTQDTDAVNVAQLNAKTATTPLTVGNTGAVDALAPADTNKLVTAGDIANAINKAGFTLTTVTTANGELGANSTNNELINAGDTVTVEADKNIKVTQTNGKISIATKDDVNFNSVTAGSGANQVVLGDDGVKVGGNTYISDAGLNANDKKITNVANGDISANSKDAINGSQLRNTADDIASIIGGNATVDNAGNVTASNIGGTGANTIDDAIKTVKTTVKSTDNTIKVTANTANANDGTVFDISVDAQKLAESAQLPVVYTDADGNKVYKVNGKFTKDPTGQDASQEVTATNVIASMQNADGTTATATKLANIANGDVSANSKEAINGSQLYTTNQNVANNATAIANNATEIAKGLNFGANDQTATSNTAINRKLGDTIGIKGGITDTSTATSGENVITRTDANGNINIELAKNAKFDSVTTGGTKLSDAGLSFVDTSGSPVANSPSISNTGINAGNQVIAGVKAGTQDTDAVNVAQLNAKTATTPLTVGNTGAVDALAPADTNKLVTAGDIANAINKAGFTLTTVTTANGELGANSTNNELINAGDTVTVEADKNIKVTQTNGKISIATKDDVNFNSVTAGSGANQVVLGDDGVKVGGNTYISGAGLNANDKKITNVAAGAITATSKDAVNGSQLHAQGTGVQNIIGGNTVYNPQTGTYTNADIGGTGKGTIHDAISAVNSKATQAKTTVTAGKNVVVSENKNTDGSTNYTVATADNLDVTSVKAGNTVLNNAGVKVGDNVALTNAGLTAGNVSVTNAGINAGGNKITGVAAGSADTDAVNVSQLNAVKDNVKTSSVSAGTAVTVTPTVSGNNTDYKVDLTDAAKADIAQGVSAKNTVDTKGLTFTGDTGTTGIKKLGDSVAVTGDSNITTTATGTGVQVKLNDNIAVNGANIGGVTINNGGINANDKVISGVASGLNGKTLDDIKADANAPERSNAATIGDLTTVQNNVTTISNNYTTTINKVIGGTTPEGKVTNANGETVKDVNGNDLDVADALKTYNVQGNHAKTDNTVITAIKNINEGGTKFFHVNDGTGTQNVEGSYVHTEDSAASGDFSAAIGYQAKSEGKNAIALGTGAQANAENTISIGTGNIVNGKNSGAIGDPSIINGTNSYSVGNHNTVATDSTFVLGNNVTQTLENSVILGDKSSAKEVHTTAAGGHYTYAGANDANVAGVNDVVGVVSVGTEGQTRQVQNVAAGVVSADSTDAINGSQLYHTNEAIGNVANYTANLGNQLSNRINDVEDGANAGVSSAMAMAALPQAYIPGKSMLTGGMASYNGEGAVAVGLSKLSDNGRWVLKVSGSADTQGNAGAAIGAGFHF